MGHNQSKEKFTEQSLKKVLILGIPDAGKTTLLMQLRTILAVPLEEEEISTGKRQIQKWTLKNLQIILKEIKLHVLKKIEPETIKYVRIINEFTESGIQVYPDILNEAVDYIWESPLIQEALQSTEPFIRKPIFHFIKNRVFTSAFEPTIQDIIQIYVPSQDLTELRIARSPRIDGQMRIVEIPGPRYARKKWIQTVERFEWVLFVTPANVSEATKEFDETLTYFDSISNSRLFRGSKFVLIMSKIDVLFEELARNNQALQFQQQVNDLEERYLEMTEQSVTVFHVNLLNQRSIEDIFKEIISE